MTRRQALQQHRITITCRAIQTEDATQRGMYMQFRRCQLIARCGENDDRLTWLDIDAASAGRRRLLLLLRSGGNRTRQRRHKRGYFAGSLSRDPLRWRACVHRAVKTWQCHRRHGPSQDCLSRRLPCPIHRLAAVSCQSEASYMPEAIMFINANGWQSIVFPWI